MQDGKPYDVVFVDWQMPGLDGWQTAQELRESAGTGSDALVMMVTAHGREMLSQRSAGEQAALGGFLVKPVTASMLFDAVANARLGVQMPEASAQAADGQRLQGLRLLVVEDNANNRQVAQELLMAEGARVDLAENGQEGVQAVVSAQPPYDAVLMDLQMPLMDGLTATARIRETEGFAALPIIAMTANAMSSDREACLAAGMNDHVGKPFDLSDLVNVLRRHTGREGVPPSLSASSAPEALSPQALALGSRCALALEAALERLGGNVSVYARMLRTFLADLPGNLQRLQALALEGQGPEQALTLHTLRGLAGMLGARELAQRCGDAEAAVRESQRSGVAASPQGLDAVLKAASPLLQHGADLVSLLMGGLAAVQAAGDVTLPPPDADALPGDRAEWSEELRSLLRDLVARLEASDMQAMGYVERLQAHRTALGAEHLSRLESAVDRLEFDAAARLCRQWLEGPAT
jgi:CheY-like chemotaxis protein/HPt (histidine-containing phosphotransfer) domain-containing protein